MHSPVLSLCCILFKKRQQLCCLFIQDNTRPVILTTGWGPKICTVNNEVKESECASEHFSTSLMLGTTIVQIWQYIFIQIAN